MTAANVSGEESEVAYEVVLRGPEERAKVRNPWGVFGLSLVTLGVYTCFWWYFVNRELASYGRAKGLDLGSNPVQSAIAFSLGYFLAWAVYALSNGRVFPIVLLIPTIWTIVTTTKRIQKAQMAAGLQDPLSGWVASAVWIFSLMYAGAPYTQWHLNKVWEREPKLVPKETTLSDSPIDLERLQKLATLRDSGALTEDEFAAEKARILSTGRAQAGAESVATNSSVDRFISGKKEGDASSDASRES
jgi:hypothetical protein